MQALTSGLTCTFMYDGIYAGAEMGGNMRMLLMMLMTSWMIWWAATSVGAAEVSFDTEGATEETYNDFLEAVRTELASGRVSYEIPVLRRKSDVHTAKQRFLLVTLTNSAGDNIILALDVVTAQLVAYQATDDRSFFFSDAPKPQSNSLFEDTDRTTFKFSSTHTDISAETKANRSTTPLGMARLSTAIHDLHVWSSGPKMNLGTGLLVVIQMVSEAARISYIQRAVAENGLGTADFNPDYSVTSYEDNWERLSTSIQTSANGKFSSPVELQKGDGTKYNVTRVNDVLRNDLALLKSFSSISRSSQLIVVAEDEGNINGLIMAMRKFNPGRQNTIQA